MGTSTSAASLRAAKVARVASTTSATLRMSRTGTAAIVRRSDAGSAVCVETSAILSSLHAGFLADSTCSRCHRSEEHTSELQSLMRISYAVFCLKKKTDNKKVNKEKTCYNTKIIHT